MSIPKTNLRPETRPVSVQKSQAPVETKELDPKPLLDSLRAKYQQFIKLKEEGFIHERGSSTMEAKLKQTIADLENLIPQLEEKNV